MNFIWNFGETLAKTVVVAENKNCFIKKFDAQFIFNTGRSQNDLDKILSDCAKKTEHRGHIEKSYWAEELEAIQKYTRERAITELIKTKKINEKIRQIDLYIKGISRD